MSKNTLDVEPLRVEMLGRFSVILGEDILLEDLGRSRKIWNLLAYLLHNRNRQLASVELTELLCGDDRSDDPVKAVKNLVYRLRRLLNESSLPQAEYIVQSRGTYGWNPDIPVTLDVEVLTQAWQDAKRKGDNRKDALQKYFTVIDTYKGRFLPGLIYEEWTVTENLRYQRIFIESIIGAYAILEEEGQYEPIIPICQKAIALNPQDEDIYRIYIDALIQLGRQKEALEAYETITGKLYHELGVNPSKELRLLYRSILKSIKSVEMDLLAIKEDLNEPGAVDGTYCCEYEIFKEVYRFVARGVERTGDITCVMLCTITDLNDAIPSPEHLTAAMAALKSALFGVLRKGDLFAQYSYTQYILMLPSASHEKGGIVEERIAREYKKQRAGKHTKVHFKRQPLDPKID